MQIIRYIPGLFTKEEAQTMRHLSRATIPIVAIGALFLATSCSPDTGNGSPADTLTIAVIDNQDTERLRELSDAFTAEHPEATIEWVVQDENTLRQTVSTDVGTQTGRFDVVTLGTYEVEVWSDRELLTPLTEISESPDTQDFIPTVREALSHEGVLLASPLYAESVFTMYRTDVFEAAGIEMPEEPTWDDILDIANGLSESPEVDIAPVCIRGLPGWGQNVASLSAMAHSYGARWYDEEWAAQLDSPEWTRTLEDYVALAEFASDDVATSGHQENLLAFADGECALWVDSTISASFLADPEQSSVADDVGFAPAPTGEDRTRTSWLWSWALAIPSTSNNPELAEEFVAWVSSDDYIDAMVEEYGWVNAPAGAHRDLYENPDYVAAAPFAPLVLEAIASADVTDPATTPVPYVGIQYVAIPAFQSTGTAVGQQLTDAIQGEVTVAQAQENAQWVTNEIIEQARAVEHSEEEQ